MTYRIMLLVELTNLSDMSDNFVVMSLYTAVSLGSRWEDWLVSQNHCYINQKAAGDAFQKREGSPAVFVYIGCIAVYGSFLYTATFIRIRQPSVRIKGISAGSTQECSYRSALRYGRSSRHPVPLVCPRKRRLPSSRQWGYSPFWGRPSFVFFLSHRSRSSRASGHP